jgi:hypothetical protein
LAYGEDPAGIYTTSRTAFIESADAYKSPLARAPTAPGTWSGRVIEATTIEDECPSIELIREDIVEIGGIHIAAKRITGQ